MFRRLVACGFGLTLCLGQSVPVWAQAAPGCQFVLGFKAIHDAIPAAVGDCHDNEHPAGAGEEQHTSGGLMAWRKADNWTAFTDGYRTWVNGPNGLQERLNTQRFPWEHDSVPARSLQCTAGDQGCALAQQVLPHPSEATAGYTLASEWREQIGQGPSYNALLINGTVKVTVQVEPRTTEYGPNSANDAYVTQINPGPWSGVRHANNLGYSSDEYTDGSDIHFGWRNKNVFIMLDVSGTGSTDLAWLMPMAQAMQGRLAGLIGAEPPENYGTTPVTAPAPAPAPPPPAPQPVPPSPVSAPPPPAPIARPRHRWVIYLGGFDSSYGSELAGAATLERSLMVNDGYSAGDIVYYSYAGFQISPSGVPFPQAYPCALTGQSIDQSAALLLGFVQQLNRAYPGDDIAIVGHSLGGLIAYEVASYAASIGARLNINAVVAIDSPLHGVSANAALLGLFACGAGPALNQLNAMFDDAATPTHLQTMYASAHLVGARVGVVANQADCLYFWGMCANGFGRDTRGTEFAPADWSLAPSVGDPLAETIEQSHGAVLYDPGVMGEVAAFIGRQGQ